jgi:hypothetical protein
VPFYEFDVVSPANTLRTAPTQLLARLTKGVVTRVAVQIPLGVKALTGAEIWRGDHKVWPQNPDGFFKGDDVIIEWDEDYLLEDEPLQLRLRVWNDDDSFQHTITFRFGVLPLAAAEERRAGPGLLRRVAEFLGVR